MLGMDSHLKKTAGALKDAASIGLAKLNRPKDFIDIAVVKATKHNDTPPKEKHVLTAFAATESSESRPRLKRVVEERLRRTKNWMVALKTLALIHRLMRYAHPCIFTEQDQQEKQNSSDSAIIASTSLQFDDRSSPLASDCSVWVRKYSAYLDQRLRCNKIFLCDILSERHHQRKNDLDVEYIFLGLPPLQQLLGCLLNCTPHGNRVVMNPLIQYALDLLVKDGRNLYGTINHFICKLVDSFISGMPRNKVVKLINIYKQFSQQCDRLTEFYDTCRLILPSNIDLPRVERPSESVLAQMENYVKKCANHTSAKESTEKPPEETPHTEGEEATQIVVPLVSTGEAIEERLSVTWWDAHDDVPPSDVTNCNTLMELGSTNPFVSSKDTAETSEGNACNDWEKALDSSITNPSVSYQPEGAMDRIFPPISFDNDFLRQKRGGGTNENVIMSGYGTHHSVADDMLSMEQMVSEQCYIPENNLEDAGGLPHGGALHNYPKTPFEHN